MTAEAFAALVEARRTGSGWQARCPAHRDRSPSLSIARGDAGRVLIHCHAGCAVPVILQAAGLRMADLFDGPPATPEQMRVRREHEARRQAIARARRIAHGRVCDVLLKLERIASEFGSKLMCLPDDSPEGLPFARLFHQVQDRIRIAEARELELRP